MKKLIIYFSIVALLCFMLYIILEDKFFSIKKVSYNQDFEVNSKLLLNLHQSKVLRNLALLLSFFAISYKLAKDLPLTEKKRLGFIFLFIFLVLILLISELFFLEKERKVLLRISGLNETVDYMEHQIYGYGLFIPIRKFIGHSLSFMSISIFWLLFFYVISRILGFIGDANG